MAASPIIDPEQFLAEQLARASPDLMRELLGTFVNTLLSAQADSVCGAEYGARSQERTNRRSGYRTVTWIPGNWACTLAASGWSYTLCSSALTHGHEDFGVADMRLAA